jgi:outer membrane cobalamin receptor
VSHPQRKLHTTPVLANTTYDYFGPPRHSGTCPGTALPLHILTAPHPHLQFRPTPVELLVTGYLCLALFTNARAQEPVPWIEIEVRAAPFSNTTLSTPAIEQVYDGENLKHSPSLSLDGVLRSAPGFRLFRRTDSTVANPTTQGVSLGNVGPNGASRSILLLDGVPMNDPFGGWVPWSRFLPSSLSGVRLVPQGGVSPWGTASLGGVIAMDSRYLNDAPFTMMEASAGNRLRHQGALAFAHDTDSARTRIFGGVQETHFDGYPVIRDDRAGPVDGRASSRTEAFDFGARQALSQNGEWHLTLRTQGWQEARNNGTPLTTNNSGALDFSARLTRDAGLGNWALESILFTQHRRFESIFSTVSPDRTSEKASLDQYGVPSNSFGFIQRLRFPLKNGHSLGAGIDLRTTEGITKERFKYVSLSPTQEREAGGRQNNTGLYLHDTWSPSSKWQFYAGSRLDWTQQSDGHLREWDIQTQTPLRNIQSQDRAELTPHFSFGTKWIPRRTLEWSALAYTGGRTPTLNELYRPFRAGEVSTLANPALRRESTVGGELGLKITPAEQGSLQLRAFENRIEDAIANINLVRGPGTFTEWGFLPVGNVGARRENIEKVTVRGLEGRLEWKIARCLSVATSWLATQSRVKQCRIQHSLEGRSLPQVPSHQASLQAKAETERWRWDLVLRWVGRQFDDDANQYTLDAFFTADLRVTRRVGSHTELFAAAENINNAEIQTRRDPNGTVAIGAPRMWTAGVRREF